MKRLLFAAIASAALCAPVLAQISPTDTGAGTKRGIQELNTSGQVGTVTLFRRGAQTRVVVEMNGSANKPEAVTIHRGRDCETVSQTAAAQLGDLHNGRSVSTVNMSVDRLLSGNYSVIVFANNSASAHPVACGHLY